MTSPARITRPRKALLTPAEAERAADLVKVLAASRGLNGKALFDTLSGAGHPGTYSSLLRFLNSGRVPTVGEIDSLARFFRVSPDYLTSPAGQVPPKRQPRLIEFDVPAPAPRPEGPLEAPVVRSLSTLRGGSRKVYAAAELAALADSVASLAAAVREQTEWQKTASWPGVSDQFRDAG
jgi:hypothetical protein